MVSWKVSSKTIKIFAVKTSWKIVNAQSLAEQASVIGELVPLQESYSEVLAGPQKSLGAYSIKQSVV